MTMLSTCWTIAPQTMLDAIFLNTYAIPSHQFFQNWGPDAKVCVDFKGEPIGIPEEHRAQLESTSLAWTVLVPHVQIHRNLKWINYHYKLNGIPLLHGLIDKTINSLFGQYVQRDLVYESVTESRLL